MPRLIAQTADFAGQTFELTEPTITLGRNDQNKLHIPHSSVSSKHAVFVLDGLDYAVRDTGSTNGTRVNGDRISINTDIKLRRNDTISFGNIDFIYDSEHVPPGRPMPELAQPIKLEQCISRGKPASFKNSSPMPRKRSSPSSPLWITAFLILFILLGFSIGYFGYIWQEPPALSAPTE
jgi:predicted component of type VI protein secretion system